MSRWENSTVVRGFGILVLFGLAACGGGERKIVEPPPTGSADFTLTVRPDPEDAGIAQQLGWTAGIPGAEVSIAQAGFGGSGQTFTTSATGTVAIAGLQSGAYSVSVRRLLSGAEITRLGTAGSAVAFVGESEISVSSSSGSATINVPASRRRSLVISEFSFRSRNIPGSDTYLFGGFLELYNNSDTTVYLDGVLVADAYATLEDLRLGPCATLEPFRNDPAGIWTPFLAAFPGSGRNYPLRPGANVVVATDAIDHTVIYAGMIDLRAANFEFIGPADVDNPAVPNMIDHSLKTPLFGHGINFPSSLHAAAVIGSAADPVTLPRSKIPLGTQDYNRLPREGMLDVFTTSNTYYLQQQPPTTLCPQIVNAAMDRQYGFFQADSPDEYLVSISRKVLTTLADGRLVLQHTRTSANDFQRTPRTPGTVQR
ncbi:MAG: DUF4876 domain-containing protein [Gemmatimonadaceae bacterium]